MSTSSKPAPAIHPSRSLALALWLAAAGCGARATLLADAALDGHAASDRSAEAPANDADVGETASDASVADTRDAASEASADRPMHTDGATTDGTRGAPCWSDNDCHQGGFGFLLCQAPGESFGCPICDTPPATCATDQQCADAGAICEPATCACHGEKICVAGCASDTGCALGFACGADHRCAPRPCAADVACPTNFVCVSGSGCRRKGCLRDDECSFACVKGACYDRAGACAEPPA